MWDEITYPFTNLNGAAVKVWEWINNFVHILLGMWLHFHYEMHGILVFLEYSRPGNKDIDRAHFPGYSETSPNYNDNITNDYHHHYTTSTVHSRYIAIIFL